MIEPIVRAALLEDIGRGGDLTTDSIVDSDAQARAHIVARAAGVISGIDCARIAFQLLDPQSAFEVLADDANSVSANDRVATITASARALLTAERTALNFLCHLSGIATATRLMVDGVRGTRAKIVCTRKTTPGLRALEKYAVRCGGGFNHRFGLDDAVLIKDNHLAIAGSVSKAVQSVRERSGHLVKIEVEADNLEQVAAALECGVDAILLDNMTPADLAKAVEMTGGRALTEASGGVTPERIAAIAATGVDLISSGWITHSAPALDLALDVEE